MKILLLMTSLGLLGYSGLANAYANYRLTISANVMGQKYIASDALNVSSHTLESLIERQVDVAYLSLLASVYGMQIALDSSKDVTAGLKSSNAIKRTEALDAHNPRLILVKFLHTNNLWRKYAKCVNLQQQSY